MADKDKERYPSDVGDEEWAFVAPYLTLMTEDAPQRVYELREVFNGLRYVARSGAPWRMMPREAAEAEGRQGKQPYRVQAHARGDVGAREARGDEVVAFAGLYDFWRGPLGEGEEEQELHTYTIVTTQASPGLERLHPRMPVILTREAEEVWLDPLVKDAERLMDLLVPYPSEQLRVYPVGRAVNSPENDWPAIIDPAALYVPSPR